MHQALPLQGSRHIPLLDGLRGIAAIAVLLGHLDVPGIAQAPLAVDFFFLLSGYVMARSYERRFAAGMTFAEFAEIRLIRLYPTMLLGSLLLLAVILLGFKHLDDGDNNLLILFILQVLLIPVFASGQDIFRINGVQWSLFFELVANAVHRLFYHWLSLPVLAGICGTSLVILVLGALLKTKFTLGWWGDNAWVGIGRVGFSYFLGVALFRAVGDMPPAGAIRSPALLVMAAFCAALAIPKIPGIPVNGVGLATISVVFPIIILLSLRTRISALTARICTLLGELSYPLYATHGAITIPAGNLAEGRPPVEVAVIQAAAAILALALAFAASRFWDIPIRRWLRRRTL